MHNLWTRWTVSLLVVLICRRAHPADVMLSDESGARAAIWVGEKARPDEKLAASEVGKYLEKITGFPFKIVSGNELLPGNLDARITTIIGIDLTGDRLRYDEGRLYTDALPGENQNGCNVWVAPDFFKSPHFRGGTNWSARHLVLLSGHSSEETLFAAYEFLEQLGCRWYMPGELGEVVPRRRALAVPEGHTQTMPSFAGRHLQGFDMNDPWYRRNRLGGPFFPSAHASDTLLPAAKYFKEHPEYYALVGGQRGPAQLCYTSEEGTRVAAQNMIAYLKSLPAGTAHWVGIGPNDGGGFCRCENCMKLYYEWDPYSNEWSISDAFITWANQLARLVHSDVPDARFAFYIYHTYNLPPLHVKPDPSISGALAPITYCRVHGIRNPLCDEAHAYRRLIEGWGAIMPDLYQRGYGFQLASPQFLWSRVHVWRDEVPYAKAHGIKGWRIETPPSWGNDPITHWVLAKLMWNADASVDALLDDFHRNFYGPAAAPMKAFWTLVDARLRDGNYHTGNAWDEPKFFPPAAMKTLGRHLEAAERAAGPALVAGKDNIYARRVHATRLAYGREEAFLQMRAEFEACHYVEAGVALHNCDSLTRAMCEHNPPLLFPHLPEVYMDIFWRKSVEEAAARAMHGKRIVADLPDAWRFRTDPQARGDSSGVGLLQDWWNDSIDDSSWPLLKTRTMSWSDQGLRYYKGTAWYRATVNLPAQHDGKLMLWFGAVDEGATVWVNGREIGKKPIRSESDPFEFDITAAARPGANLIAVRVVNNELDELGTGGITKPVMVWTEKPAPKSP